MSMLQELFGQDAIRLSLQEVKRKILSLPPTIRERRSYILKEWAAIRGEKLKKDDFEDVNA